MPSFGVTCNSCLTVIWEGDDQPVDGQVIATAHADTHCQRGDCPHTTQALEAARLAAPVPRAEHDELQRRLQRLEELLGGRS